MTLTIANLSKVYKTRQGEIDALQGVSLQVDEHEFVSIVGPSGCGKSTLLKIVAGILRPDSGAVEFDGSNSGSEYRTDLVFQDHGLFPWLDLVDNVGFGLKMLGVNKETREARSRNILDKFGLKAFYSVYPKQLSGGMKQRVALARAIVSNPSILLMDEPFGALDAQTRVILQEELITIWRDLRKTVLFVTHDIDEAILLSDRILVMSGRPGMILQEFHVPVEIKRQFSERFHPAVQNLKKEIWDLIKNEVRKEIFIPALAD
jgi:NitT/TauT family transport system ATP-binding protein